MKNLFYVVLCLACLGIGHFWGSHDIFFTVDHHVICWDKDETIYTLRTIRSAQSDLLHRVYGNMDNEVWYDAIMSTPEYWELDSILNAAGCGWEDFYAWQEYTAGYDDGDTIQTPVDYQY